MKTLTHRHRIGLPFKTQGIIIDRRCVYTCDGSSCMKNYSIEIIVAFVDKCVVGTRWGLAWCPLLGEIGPSFQLKCGANPFDVNNDDKRDQLRQYATEKLFGEL